MRLRRGKLSLGILAGLVLAAAGVGLAFRRKPGAQLPNVVVVTCDSLRADRLSLYGYSRPTSPNLDALARESVVFDRFFANSSFTPPSHASILTGRYVPSHGVAGWSDRLSPDAPTIAEMLGSRGLGYRTGAFTNLDNFEGLQLTRGFDHVRVETAFPGDELNRDFFSWLDGAGKDGPRFCAWLHYWDPHRPYGFRDWHWLDPSPKNDEEKRAVAALDPAAREVYQRRWRSSRRPALSFHEERFGTGDVRVGRKEAHYDRKKESRSRPVEIVEGAPPRLLTADDDRFIADRYDGGVLYVDAWLRALVVGLRERGLLDNTILVVTSDHGESFTERDDEYFTHDPHLYDEVTRIPLLIRFPGGRHGGTRVAALGESIDLVPTILDVLGRGSRGAAPSVQGTSLMARVNGAPGPAFVHAQTQTEWTCERLDGGAKAVIHSSQHRLVLDPKSGAVEFYDRMLDAFSTTNRHTDPPSDVERAMRARLDKWLEVTAGSTVKVSRVPALMKRSVRTATHRLIHWPGSGTVELYDLVRDPGAKTNLHADPPGDVEKECLAELRRFERETPIARDTLRNLSEADLAIMRGLGYP